MSAFYLAFVGGGVVALAYLYFVGVELARTRRSSTQHREVVDDGGQYDGQRAGFSWVAGAGVVVSTGLLVLASVSASVWYVLPFLSIASAAAVVVAFLVDGDELEEVRP